jgi:hypothetical protein
MDQGYVTATAARLRLGDVRPADRATAAGAPALGPVSANFAMPLDNGAAKSCNARIVFS